MTGLAVFVERKSDVECGYVFDVERQEGAGIEAQVVSPSPLVTRGVGGVSDTKQFAERTPPCHVYATNEVEETQVSVWIEFGNRDWARRARDPPQWSAALDVKPHERQSEFETEFRFK
jgi:hypothetical protein